MSAKNDDNGRALHEIDMVLLSRTIATGEHMFLHYYQSFASQRQLD